MLFIGPSSASLKKELKNPAASVSSRPILSFVESWRVLGQRATLTQTKSKSRFAPNEGQWRTQPAPKLLKLRQQRSPVVAASHSSRLPDVRSAVSERLTRHSSVQHTSGISPRCSTHKLATSFGTHDRTCARNTRDRAQLCSQNIRAECSIPRMKPMYHCVFLCMFVCRAPMSFSGSP